MNRNRIINLKVGITVIISIFILLYGIAFLKDFKINVETNDLVVFFTDVNGLKEGDQVGVNGVPKGKVREIELSGDSVKVIFYLSKDVVLKKDYSISVSMIELMSGKQISIKPGYSKELADISKPLLGSKAVDAVSLIETLNKVGNEIKTISDKIDSTVGNLNMVITNVNDIVGDPEMKSNIKGTTANFNAASQNLVGLLQENRQSLKTLTSKLNSIADNVDKTVLETKPELRQTFDDIKNLTVRLDSIATGLNDFISNAKDSTSTVGKLMTDDQLYNNLNKTVQNIDKLIKQIKEKGLKLNIF